MTINLEKDKAVLRTLGERVKQIAMLPEQTAQKKLLSDLNSLKADRPVVLSFPEGAWSELVPQTVLQCENDLFRSWERQLRQIIYQWEVIKDDSAVDEYFNIGWTFSSGDFGFDIPLSHGDNRGSYTWEHPIKDLENDFPKLKFREPCLDRTATMKQLEIAQDMFSGILEPRIHGNLWWTTGLTATATNLVGLENFMVLMLTEPEGMHRLMAWLRDEQIHFLDWCEERGILSLNNGCDHVGSGGWGLTKELPKSHSSKISLSDLWGLSESQESVGISPDLFGEFIFPYQVPVVENFGLSCYGCCEGIQDRLEYILKIPNLRRISVSPWADQEKIADSVNGKYVFSRKPNPSDICMAFNEDSIRNDIHKTLEIAGFGSLEIILKDTHTVNNEPWRISEWVRIARSEVDKFMSKK